jgi:hypothetical protein
VTRVRELAGEHQQGRVTDEVTSVTFTEGWFREFVEDTQQAIADDLGVSEYLVSKAKTELENSGKQFGPKSLSTDEKREQKA